MCTVSDKLKLCTCEGPDSDENYWVLHRFVKGKKEMIMGECVMPASINPAIDGLNRSLLLKLLNEGNVFDEPLYPVNKDRLHICFNINGHPLNYGFVYKNKSWQEMEYDYFQWYYQHDEIKSGKINAPF